MQANSLYEYIDLLTHEGSIATISQCLKSHPEIMANTPVIYAISANRLDVVRLLINLGADINARDQFQRTALHYAVASNRSAIVQLLIQNKAILVADAEGKTPLDLAMRDAHSQSLPHLMAHYDAEAKNEAMIRCRLSQIQALNVATCIMILQDGTLLDLLPKEIIEQYKELIKIDGTHQKFTSNTFSAYAKDLRKVPNRELLIQYLNDIFESLAEQESKLLQPLSTSERKLVLARKTWSEMVSDMHTKNQQDVLKLKVKENVVTRLKRLGYNNPEHAYEACIRILKEHSVIAVTFNASFLNNKESADYQTLNIFERGNNNIARNGTSYSQARDLTEVNLFKSLNDGLKDAMKCIHSRPKYGALSILDSVSPITVSRTFYGNSFIVLKDIVKFNSLFNRRDSMNGGYGQMTPCSYFHMEYLLYQSTDERLAAIARRATQGSSQSQYNGPGEEYIEVLLPAIEFLNPDYVQHIFISTFEYKLTPADKEILLKSGIPYTNAAGTPYPATYNYFHTALQNKDWVKAEALIKQYPLLIKVPNKNGYLPIHIAAMHSNLDFMHMLTKMGSRLDEVTPEGKTAFIFAMESKNLEYLRQFMARFPEVINTPTSFDTPLIYATKFSSLDIFEWVLSICPINIINFKANDGMSALFNAVSAGSIEKVCALLQVPGIDYLAFRDPGDNMSALMMAHEQKRIFIARLLIMHSLKLKYGNQKTYSEIATEIDLHHPYLIVDPLADIFDTIFKNFTTKNLAVKKVTFDFHELISHLKTDVTYNSQEKCLIIIGFIASNSNSLNETLKKKAIKSRTLLQTIIKLNTVQSNMIEYLNREGMNFTDMSAEDSMKHYSDFQHKSELAPVKVSI